MLTENFSRFMALFALGFIYVLGYSFYISFLPQHHDLLSISLNLVFLALAAPTYTRIQKRIQLTPSRFFSKQLHTVDLEDVHEHLDKILSLNRLFAYLDNFFSAALKLPLQEIYICNQKNEKTMVAWDIENQKVSSSDLMEPEVLRLLKTNYETVINNSSNGFYQSVFLSHPSKAAMLCYENNHLIGVFFIGSVTESDSTIINNHLLEKLAKQITAVLYRALTHTRVVDNLEESQKNASLINLMNEYNHEIKGPLSILHSYATHPSLADENSLRKLIICQVERTSNILETMLNIAQNKRTRTLQSVNINSIIRQSLKLFPVTCAQIDLKLDVDLKRIEGDEEDLHILFINLLKNTVEALHKAQLDSELDLDAKIVIKTKNFADNILIELSDSGIGIPEDEINQIWEIGYSNKNTSAPASGLGLSVVKRIVDEHDGNIKVFNNHHQGVTFQIQFPFICNNSTQIEHSFEQIDNLSLATR